MSDTEERDSGPFEVDFDVPESWTEGQQIPIDLEGGTAYAAVPQGSTTKLSMYPSN